MVEGGGEDGLKLGEEVEGVGVCGIEFLGWRGRCGTLSHVHVGLH